MDLWKQICRQWNLREIQMQPYPLSGGFLHKMYGLSTDTGKYAVKLLNPHIMQRPKAIDNYRRAEVLEEILEERGIPVLTAKKLHGNKMQQVDGQYYYLFPWYPGRVLKEEEVQKFHCGKIGETLARIHQIDYRDTASIPQPLHIDWNFYMVQIEKKDKYLYTLLQDSLGCLTEFQKRGNDARRKLPSISAICHNDMDCKNVLWVGKEFRIIDLECLSYANPYLEIYEQALCWSGFDQCSIDFERFRQVLSAYQEAGGTIPVESVILYDSNYGRLEWLSYNLKRALGIDCEPEEQKLGISEANKTIRQLLYYRDLRRPLIRILTEHTKHQ